MSETHGDGNEHAHHPHHHACANLFGCGDEKGTGIIREDIKDAAFDNRASDTLLQMDQVDQETLDGYLSARGASPSQSAAKVRRHSRGQPLERTEPDVIDGPKPNLSVTIGNHGRLPPCRRQASNVVLSRYAKAT